MRAACGGGGAPARGGHVPRRDSPGVARELGRDVHGRAGLDVGVLADKPAEELFGAAVEGAGAVRVGGVKEIHAAADRVVEDLLQLGVHRGVVAPEELVAPRPRTCTGAQVYNLATWQHGRPALIKLRILRFHINEQYRACLQT